MPNPAVRSDALLRIFFAVVADRALTNRKKPDVGTPSRNMPLPRSAAGSLEQGPACPARCFRPAAKADSPRPKPIVSRIDASCAFFSAKADHQDFTA
jgi:peptide methionine sulfoxide reductase MsrA